MEHDAVARKRRTPGYGAHHLGKRGEAAPVVRRGPLLLTLACFALTLCLLVLAGTYRDPRAGGVVSSRGDSAHGLRDVMVRNKMRREDAEAKARKAGKVAQQLHHEVAYPGAEEPVVPSRIVPSAAAEQRRSASSVSYETAAEEFARLKSQRELTVEVEGHDTPLGYVQVPRFSAGPRTGDDGLLHVVFSSGCNYFQHWQSEFLLASAFLAGQRGRVTRIVSGCHDKTAETVQHRHQTFPPGRNDLLVPLELLERSVNADFGLYITPSFDGAKDFPWINKPSSINYFMEHAAPELDRMGETIIAILDPDFVFLKPLSQLGSADEDLLVSREQTKRSEVAGVAVDVARKGRPVAQRYGIEGGWVHKFDVAKIVGSKDSPALGYRGSEAAKHFSVGPPMILHRDDLLPLSRLWEQYMRPVLEVDADILADMWAYSMGAAHLGLHHTTLDQYMISVWSHHPGETGQAFRWIDKWDSMSCLDPQVPPGAKSPTFIHLASNFKAPKSKEWMYHKGHVPADILACDSPFLVESPDDVFDVSKRVDTKTMMSAWVMCNTVSRLNKIVRMYKQKYCPNGYEERHLVRLIQSKTKDRSCSQTRDKWCYPLAQIEGLGDDWRKKGLGPLLVKH